MLKVIFKNFDYFSPELIKKLSRTCIKEENSNLYGKSG